MTPDKKLRSSRRKAKPKLVQEIINFIRLYVVLTEPQLTVLALYVIHTHLVEDCHQTPYISISSPERECGKSRLMEVLELLVARPWMVVSPSEAVLFRKVHSSMPTLLWDEIDTVFAPATARFHENHRALVDQGHRRHGKVPRFIGDKVVEFRVFCPKVFAGIGHLPDTIASRSIPIRLQRRTPSEIIKDFILQDVEPEADELRERIEKWVSNNGEAVASTRPADVPEQLSDRMKEGCFSLLAIADLFAAGAEGRQALVDVLCVERVDSQQTMRVRLLVDLRTIFAEQYERHGTVQRALTTNTLLDRLHKFEESPWATYYGRGLDPKDLADLLRPYDVRSDLIKFKSGAAHGYRRNEHRTRKGVYIAGLADLWERYLGADEVTGGNGPSQ